MEELGFSTGQAPLFTDSAGCERVAKDPVKHWQLKHVDTRYFFVRGKVKEKLIYIDKIGGLKNPADILTKVAGRKLLDRHIDSYGLTATPDSREGVK